MPARVRFLIGRAGSGKTYFIKNELRACMNEGRRAVLIVPEQFTFETERALSMQLGGLLGIQVLSFARLAERAVHAQGRPFLSAQGRRMVVRRAAHNHRTQLVAFGAVARRAGFAARMDELFVSCRRFFITPDMLREAAKKLPETSALSAKLSDIATLYAATQEYLEEHYIDSEGAQNALLAALPNSFLSGAEVYIDGFELLTEQLYAILEQMMRVCKTLTVTFCMDPDPDARDAALFAPERRAYERLAQAAADIGCAMFTKPLSSIPPPPGKDPALVRLEQELYAYPSRPYQGEAAAIAVVGATDRTAEVENMADAVAAAARRGVRYRDMAVIASDMPAYAHAVQRAFARRDIPVFMDARRSMQGHPTVELLLCAARAATGGLPRAELFRIAKTGLAGVSPADAEAFENYCLRRGLLGGKVFEAPFPPEEEAAERVRAALIPPLAALRKGLTAHTAGEMTEALYEYLRALHVETQLLRGVQRLRDESRFALMEEHAQVWDILIELFEQLHAILGAAKMDKREFLEVLTEAISAYQVGIIPATADQVLFGDVNRTRSREVRALFLLGCNEGLLPAPRVDDDIIDDTELAALSKLEIAPWGDTARRAEADRLSVYRALSRANEGLWLGFSYADGTRELVPSTLIDRVRELFPGCTEHAATGNLTPDALPETPQSGFALLARNMGGPQAQLTAALRAYYKEQPGFRERLQQAEAFAREPAAPKSFGAPLAKKLYGKRLFSTVSRLETFRACPFRHFAQYGLKALPRREFREKKADIGSFSHMALEAFVREVGARGLDWAAITREEAEAMLDAIFPDCLRRYQDGLLCATPRARALSVFWTDAVRETAWALCRFFAAGDFRPVGTELRFGQDDALPPLTLRLPDGEAELSGVIDRVDAAQTEDGKRLLRVVDYKTGSRAFNYGDVADGLLLQLPVYLAAVSAAEGDAPAGMFYQPVHDPVAEEGKEEKAAAELRLNGVLLYQEGAVEATERALSGSSQVVAGLMRKKDDTLKENPRLLTNEQMELLLRFAMRRAAEIASELLSGRAEAAPVKQGQGTACAYCDYKSVCRFDTRLPGCRVRQVKKRSQQEFFRALAHNGEGEGDA